MSDYDFRGLNALNADDDTTDDEPGGGILSDLDLLRAETTEKVSKPPLKLPVPGRPGWSGSYSVDVEYTRVNGWRKAARDKGAADGVNPLKFAKLVLANLNTGISRGEHTLTDEAGEPLTFRDRAVMAIYGTTSAADTARAFVGTDADTVATADAIIDATGWGDKIEEDGDPT